MFEQQSKEKKAVWGNSDFGQGMETGAGGLTGASNSEMLSALGVSGSIQKKAMPGHVMEKMSQAFGTDFSNVHVYESPMVSQVGAKAFTSGTSIGFAPGQFQPNTYEGQSLLGHELSHVVQQSQGKVAAPKAGGLSVVDDAAFEQQADTEGRKAAKGEKVMD